MEGWIEVFAFIFRKTEESSPLPTFGGMYHVTHWRRVTQWSYPWTDDGHGWVRGDPPSGQDGGWGVPGQDVIHHPYGWWMTWSPVTDVTVPKKIIRPTLHRD